jgi:23S rRNA pseudouridine1911/1915/1917 synthase
VFLAGRFKCSRTAVTERLEGPVLGPGDRPLKWSFKVRFDQPIRVARLRHPEPDVPVDYRILFEDEFLVAVDKGPGAPVHPTRSFRTRTILTHLRAALADDGLSPAHRLDRETSGVLVFGRSRQAISALGAQFAERRVRKRYLAVVRGTPTFEQGVAEQPLGRDEDFPIDCRMRVDFDHGQASATQFKVIERLTNRALVSARPQTGRMHQIRVHLAAQGTPILGDKLYQFEGQAHLAQIGTGLDPEWFERLGHTRLALHAEVLEFEHPGTGKPMRLEAPLPEDLQNLLTGPVDGLIGGE